MRRVIVQLVTDNYDISSLVSHKLDDQVAVSCWVMPGFSSELGSSGSVAVAGGTEVS